MKTYKIGLIGFGFIGKMHANGYHSIPYCYSDPTIQAKVNAVLRSHPAQDQAVLQAFNIPLCTSDENEFWNQDMDAVDICSPNSFHYGQVLKAVEKKLAIYCEKPLTSNIEDARKLVASSESKDLITHTAFTYRYIRAVRIAKEILASGSLGEIHHFRSRFFHSSYLDPNRPISWRLEQSVAGGGALTDLGIHFLDLIRYLLGDVSWLQCQTHTFIQSRPTTQGKTQPVDVDDWALCTLGMQMGGIGSLEVSRVSGGAGNTALIEIYGSRGSLKVDLVNGDQVQYFDAAQDRWISIPSSFQSPHGEYYDPSLWPDGKQSLGRFMDAHIACIVDFLHCIHNKEKSKVNFRQALAAQELLHACYCSAGQNGEKVNIHD